MKKVYHKIVGAAIFVWSSYLLGAMYSRSMHTYAKLVRDMVTAMKYMKNEAVIHSVALDRIVEKICGCDMADAPLFCLVKKYMDDGMLFSQGFSLAVAENKILKNEDKSLLTEFAKGVSVCPMQGLSEYFDRYITVMEEKAENARKEAEKKGKLFKSVSALAGAFTAILLM